MNPNNISLLHDVSACLRDAMDAVFSTGQGIVIPEGIAMNNDVTRNESVLSPANNLNSLVHKRKSDANVIINGVEQSETNGDACTKRMCTMNGYQQCEQNV